MFEGVTAVDPVNAIIATGAVLITGLIIFIIRKKKEGTF
ncbi:MAG: LPXTG cell wall anchor domain-containing protein [Lachnoclostridium sp.]|nr:LPXTG cell wall anchor domain-containing protein [Lachnoclostridium sp.]